MASFQQGNEGVVDIGEAAPVLQTNLPPSFQQGNEGVVDGEAAPVLQTNLPPPPSPQTHTFSDVKMMQMYQIGFQPQNPYAFNLFMGVDSNRSGSVDSRELHQALSNGGHTSFSFKTVKILMRMFDAQTGSGQLAYREFESMINQLGSWRAWFDNADNDRSG